MEHGCRDILFCGTRLRISGPKRVLETVASSVAPFFSFLPADGASVSKSIVCQQTKFDPAAAPLGGGEELDVDTSLYPHLCSRGVRWEDPDRIVVRIDLGETWVVVDKVSQMMTIWQPDEERLIVELERTLKSILTISAERSGSIQCHSAAICASSPTEPGAVLLLGDMWQGKTTVLLEMLAAFDVCQLSCDTVVVSSDDATGRQVVNGWPSPFSVSHGTMSDHAQLAPFIPEERLQLSYDARWKEGKKSVFRSDKVAEMFNTTLKPVADSIRAIVILKFRTDEAPRLRKVANPEEIAAEIEKVYLGSRDPIYHNWHRWISCDDETISRNVAVMARKFAASVPVYELTWAPSVVSMLRRVSELEGLHKFAAPVAVKA